MALRRAWQQALLLGLAPLLRMAALRRGLKYLPGLLLRLPAAWRGEQYQRCRQNLELLGLEPQQCREGACHYTAIQFQRELHQRLYPRHRPEQLRTWIRSIAWQDPLQLWQRALRRRSIIVLAHSGEYWMAVACLVERCEPPARFLIPVWNFNDALTRASLKSLEAFGHRIEVLDSADPRTALAIARGLKRGERVLIFADLPVSFAGVRSGEPVPGRLFGRAAQFVKGPMFLAARMGCAVLMVGHRAHLGGAGELRLLDWIDCAEAHVMQATWARRLEVFIAESPQDWFYLSRLEAFYQRQKTAAEHATKLPMALQRRAGR